MSSVLILCEINLLNRSDVHRKHMYLVVLVEYDGFFYGPVAQNHQNFFSVLLSSSVKQTIWSEAILFFFAIQNFSSE